MGFKIRISYLVLAIIVVLALVSSSYASWVHVTSFTGSGSQRSADFYMPAGYWRVVWSCTPETSLIPQNSYFEVSVRNTSYAVIESDLYEGVAPDGATMYIEEGGKEYNVMIVTSNIDNYTITVEYDDAAPGNGSLLGGDYDKTLVMVMLAVSVVVVISFIIINRKGRDISFSKSANGKNGTEPKT